MPRAIALPLREQIVTLRQSGKALTEIAQQLQLRYRTVRALWGRFRKEGLAGLQTRYSHCGPHGPRSPSALVEAALSLKRGHPRWGAVLILLELAETFPDQGLPHPRTLQCWFAQAGLQPVRVRRLPGERRRAQAVHEVWEVDAKERLRLQDGSGASTLSATDEASGALLGSAVFPPVSLDPGPWAGGPGSAAAVV